MPPVFAFAKAAREGRTERGTYLDLIETGHRARQLEEDFLRRHNLNHSRFVILALLDDSPSGNMHAAELADLAGVSRSSMTSLIDGLERLDFVRRRPDPHDRRAIGIKITPSGETLVTHVLAARRTWMSWMDAAMGSDDAEDLRRLLCKVRDAIDHISTRP